MFTRLLQAQHTGRHLNSISNGTITTIQISVYLFDYRLARALFELEEHDMLRKRHWHSIMSRAEARADPIRRTNVRFEKPNEGYQEQCDSHHCQGPSCKEHDAE